MGKHAQRVAKECSLTTGQDKRDGMLLFFTSVVMWTPSTLHLCANVHFLGMAPLWFGQGEFACQNVPYMHCKLRVTQHTGFLAGKQLQEMHALI